MHYRMLFALLSLCLVFYPVRAQSETITVAGETRSYVLHIPPGLDAPVPLLMVLHGGGGTPRQAQRLTGFNRIADREGFIVVYPQGINEYWNDGRVFRNASKTDDVAFFAALIDYLLATQPVDSERIFVTGISNGGFMSFRLACELSPRIAGIAPVTATLSEDLGKTCAPEQPLKVLVINGTADPLVPYEGGSVSLLNFERGEVRSTADTMQFWAAHNGCDAEPVITDVPDTSTRDETTAQIAAYSNCTQPVQLITIIDGGHTWPSRAQYLPVSIIGRTNRDMDASQVIWDFFAGG